MPGIFVNDNGTLREIQKVFVNDNGTLREIQQGFVNDNGTLRQFFSAGVVTLSGQTVTAGALDPANATAAIRIDADGNVYGVTNGTSIQVDTSTDWVRPTASAPSDYEVRYTNAVGDGVTGTVAEDAWHALSSGDFSVQISQGTVGSGSSTFDIEIRKGSSGAAIASASYTLEASVTS